MKKAEKWRLAETKLGKAGASLEERLLSFCHGEVLWLHAIRAIRGYFLFQRGCF